MTDKITETQLQELMEEVSEEMPGWNYVDRKSQGLEWGCYLKDSEGHSLYVRGDSFDTHSRIEISGSGDNGFYMPDVKITVAATKTAKQIAKDIERRLLPNYLAKFEEMSEKQAKTDAYNERCHANARLLADAFGVDYDPTKYANRDFSVWTSHGSFRVSDKSVYAERLFSIPLSKMLRIAAILREDDNHADEAGTEYPFKAGE
jgi:hypothetical protein